MIFPWARVLISAGAHGLRRIPGQSVNLAHLIWRAPRAPAPLPSGNKVHPRRFSARGYGCWGHQQKRCHPGRRQPSPRPHAAKSLGVPALRYRFGGDDRVGWTKISTQAVFAAGYASLKTYFVSTREDAIPFCFKKA